MIDINKSFPGVKALDHAQLKVRPGTIHSLVGENGAGKSTLMKCLFGIYIEDSGTIIIDGDQTKFETTKEALENGVSMVHQELNQVLKRNIMENIWLGRFPMKGFLVDEKKMYEDTKKIFERLGIKLDPRDDVGTLSVSQRQMVEIAKAVSYDAKILVLDEPTSSLTDSEIDLLFDILNQLRREGVGIIYISHKMEEILNISDEVTVMRDGEWIATEFAEDLTINRIIQLMVGRSLENRYPDKKHVPGETMMELKNVTGMYEPTVREASFTLRKGEVLGISGLVGSRRTELLELIFGTATIQSGDIIINGKSRINENPSDAIKNKMGFVTEERRATGIFEKMDITSNAVIANMNQYIKNGLTDDKHMREDTARVIEGLNVKTPSQKALIGNLSGGNQQKVIIGRWLLTDADIYLLDEPTRGIDVGAKYEIYQIILNLAEQGKSVIMVSSELPELLGVCDRILVMSNGRVAGVDDVNNLDQENIMALATKYV
jgi:methyl-galactoside transport system ATP-binding protein